MELQCACGDFHNLSPAGLILVIHAYQNGELQTIGPMTQITARCMMTAFTQENVDRIKRLYPKRKLVE